MRIVAYEQVQASCSDARSRTLERRSRAKLHEMFSSEVRRIPFLPEYVGVVIVCKTSMYYRKCVGWVVVSVENVLDVM